MSEKKQSPNSPEKKPKDNLGEIQPGQEQKNVPDVYGTTRKFSEKEAVKAAEKHGKKWHDLPEGLSYEEASRARLNKFRKEMRSSLKFKKTELPHKEEFGIPSPKGNKHFAAKHGAGFAGGMAGKKIGKEAGGNAGAAAGAAIAGSLASPTGPGAAPAAGVGAAVGRFTGKFVGGRMGKKAGKEVGKHAGSKAYKELSPKTRLKEKKAVAAHQNYKQAEKEFKKYRQEERKEKLRGLVKVIIALAIFYPIFLLMLTVFAAAAPAIAFSQGLGAVIEFLNLDGQEEQVEAFTKALEENASEEDLQQIASYEDTLKRTLDCSVLPPSERKPDVNCVEGLLAEEESSEEGSGPWSPIPKRAYWLVPVWQKAAARYGVPWEVVAAINGARTNFGSDTCDTQEVMRSVPTANGPPVRRKLTVHRTGGVGFYRIPEGTWSVNNVEAGADNAAEYNPCAPKGDTLEVSNPDGPEENPSVLGPVAPPSSTASSQEMKWPTIPKTPIGSGFGPRSSPGGIGSTNHQGVDMSVPEGTKVVAVLDGVVKIRQANGGYGNYILLEHSGGLETAYAHLSQYKVAVGQRVRQGQVIALSGNTGISTGPHLHFEVLRNGAQVDPAPVLQGAGVAEEVSGLPGFDLLSADQPRPYIRASFLEPLETIEEVKSETSPPGNPHDAVDASFATAKALSRNGAWDQEKWEYNGKPYDQCDVPGQEGSLTYPPTPPSGVAGGSGTMPNLEGIEEYEELFAVINKRYPGHFGVESGKTRLSPQLVAFLAQAAGQVVGVRIPGVTMAQVARGESTYYPGNMGCDACLGFNNTTGYGLWQITSGVGNDALVEPYGGYEEMLNPVKNALVMATMYKNAKAGGDPLSPWFGTSYVTGNNLFYNGGTPPILGDAATASETEETGAQEPKDYQGKKATDEVSRSVRQTSLSSSDCYVAMVHAWYELIKEHPPEGALGGDVRSRIVEIARAELKKGVSETNGDNVPRYTESGEKAVYNINSLWCQAFGSRVWYWAGIKKPLTQLGGLAQEDGVSLPALVAAVTEWGKSKGLYKTKNPLPGDFVMRGGEHVEIVEKVANGKVVSTIGGNTSDRVARNMGDQGWTHYVSPPNADSEGSYNNAAQLSVEDAGIAVLELEGNKSALAGNILSGPAFSTIKAPIAAAVYKKNSGPGSYAGAIKQALQNSDNASAMRLWESLGSNAQAAKKVDNILREGGDSATSTSTTKQGCSECYSVYGQTDWALADQARWLRGAVRSRKPEMKYITSTMKGVGSTDKAFGLGTIQGATLWKGGWGDNQNGGWARQMGLLRVGSKQRIVAVIAKAETATAAQQKLTELVRKYATKPIDGIGGSASASSSSSAGPGASTGPGNRPIRGNDIPTIVRRFAAQVAEGSGLSESVVATWALEEGGHLYNGARFNFLNIGPGRDFASFEEGVKTTLDLLHSRNGFTINYKGILRSAGQSDRKQIKAITQSPWCPPSDPPCVGYFDRLWKVYSTRVIR